LFLRNSVFWTLFALTMKEVSTLRSFSLKLFFFTVSIFLFVATSFSSCYALCFLFSNPP
jgi:hypothetical protein